MAMGALSGGNVEGEIRKKIIEEDLVYGIIACPPKLFYNVSLPVSLWFLRKSKPEHMKNKILFVYAKKMFKPISRRQVIFSKDHIDAIVNKFRMFEGGKLQEIDEIGFAAVSTIDDIAKNNYVLTPGRYVGIKADEDEIPFEEKMKTYSEILSKLISEEAEAVKKLKDIFDALGFQV